jgi:large repetitive protein
MVVANLGAEDLKDVQVIDNLAATFPAPVTYSVVSVNATGSLVINPAYDGSSVTNTLNSGASTLVVGAIDTVRLVVRVTLNGDSGLFYNTAVAVGTSVNGYGVTSDDSDNGYIVDTDGDGLPDGPNENNPTPIRLLPNEPVIAVTKVANTPRLLADYESYEVTYTVSVQNIGSIPVTNVQLSDNLSLTFPSPVTYSVTGITGTTNISPNTGFDGVGQVNLLSGTDGLAVGEVATVEFTVVIRPNGVYGDFANIVIGTGNGLEGFGLTTDTSDADQVIDPNGDGIGNQPGENDPTVISLPKPEQPLFIPQGFSPDGDGVNDVFEIEGAEDKTVSIVVYNRWGNMVYESQDYQNDWAGLNTKGISFGQDALPDGTYWYIISLNDGSADKIGYLTIKRK